MQPEIDVPEGWNVEHLQGTEQRRRIRIVGASPSRVGAGEVRIRFPELNESAKVKITLAGTSSVSPSGN